MKPSLLDTDTISFHLKGKATVTAQIDAYLLEYDALNISVVTYYEIMNGLLYLDARRQLKDFEKLVSVSRIFPLTIEIALRAAEIFADLRRSRQEIGHTDVLIAATALHHGLIVVSNNQSHFSRITDLPLDNWL